MTRAFGSVGRGFGVSGRAITQSVIPDSAIAQYDATELDLFDGDTVSSWPDAIGNEDLDGGNGATYKENVQNGNAVVRFDGVDDYLETALSETFSQPTTIYIVAKTNTTSSNQGVFDHNGSGNRQILEFRDLAEYQLYSGSNAVSGGALDTDWHIHTVEYNGGTGTFRKDGQEVFSGSSGSDGLASVRLGSNDALGRWLDGDIGEVVPHNAAFSDIDGEEQRLADKWGITI